MNMITAAGSNKTFFALVCYKGLARNHRAERKMYDYSLTLLPFYSTEQKKHSADKEKLGYKSWRLHGIVSVRSCFTDLDLKNFGNDLDHYELPLSELVCSTTLFGC